MKRLVSADQAISKIHFAVDNCGLPVSFTITGGQIHNALKAPELIDSLPLPYTIMLTDKGYDSEVIRQQVVNKGAILNMPRQKNPMVGNTALECHLCKL